MSVGGGENRRFWDAFGWVGVWCAFGLLHCVALLETGSALRLNE